MKKIIINKKFYGKVELADSKNAYQQFVSLMNAFKKKEDITLRTIFSQKRIKRLQSERTPSYRYTLSELDMFIEIGKLLKYSYSEAEKLKETIEFLNDSAQVNLDISKNLSLFNKPKASKTKNSYLFWDIENFSNVSPMFIHVIEPHEIEDENIYISCNPDSLWLFKAEWEADLYDFSKTLNSFNFTKCDHGKNVADGVLLKNFQDLNLRESDIYVLTYDRDLKERFKASCDKSNNMYVLERKILN
ncbi:hypothetical protein N9A28_00285 [Sulfurimonas sp.]|nr:hypothetical protein [Sulfurimonas sp.]